ncbi:MAG: TorF family putative porin [Alphaproteobacteria bacterium]
MTRLKTMALAGAAVSMLAVSGPAFAEEESDWSFSGNIALTNDYVFRGFTQTNEDWAVQGGLDIEHSSGFYAGTWASNIEFLDGNGNNSTSIEIDLYAGFAGDFGNSGISYDVGAIFYAYPGDPAGSNADYWEFWASISADLGLASIGTGITYSPDFFGGTGDMIHIPLDLEVPVPLGSDTFGISFSGQLGYNELLDNGQTWDGISDDYLNWNIGLTVSITDWFDMDFRYHDTDLNEAFCTRLCDERFTFMISRSL